MKYSKANGIKIMIVGITFGIAANVVNMLQKNMTDYVISRPAYGEAETQYALKVSDGENEVTVPLVVSPQMYSEDEVMAHFQYVKEQLAEVIKGDNESLEAVRENLNLIEVLEGEAIVIQWYSSDYRLVDFDGQVFNQAFVKDQVEACTVRAQLSYAEYDEFVDFPIVVMEPVRTEAEQYQADVEHLLSQANEEQPQADTIALPEALGEKTLHYENSEEEIPAILFPMLALAVVLVLYIGNIEDVRRKEKERLQQLTYDYSEVVSKFTLLVGAGMPFAKAWEKMVLDYEKKKGEGNTRYVYEEMKETLYEMKAGISELQAYERFGKRCNTKEYMKLASLLQQNLKKGSKGLARMLEEEAIEAFDKRKNLAVQKGEEAGTKLLIPMMIMLVVVMMIVMVPALLSFKM